MLGHRPAGADYTTQHVLDALDGDRRLEEAIHDLSMAPAMVHGLWDPGQVRAGARGDLLVIDPVALAVGEPRFVADLPTGASRLVIDAGGYRYTIVNGQVLLDNGAWTGTLPGMILDFTDLIKSMGSSTRPRQRRHNRRCSAS